MSAKKRRPKEALRKEVSPSAFVISRNDWIVGKKTIILEGYKMEKYIYNEKNGLWYELQDDYYLPCLKLPEDETAHIGVWGRRHLRYLKQHHRVRYYNLLATGKLNSKRERNGNAQSGKPNAVGTEDEQSEKRRYGNRIKRAYLSLTLHK